MRSRLPSRPRAISVPRYPVAARLASQPEFAFPDLAAGTPQNDGDQVSTCGRKPPRPLVRNALSKSVWRRRSRSRRVPTMFREATLSLPDHGHRKRAVERSRTRSSGQAATRIGTLELPLRQMESKAVERRQGGAQPDRSRLAASRMPKNARTCWHLGRRPGRHRASDPPGARREQGRRKTYKAELDLSWP